MTTVINSLGTCGGYETITPTTKKGITATIRIPTTGANALKPARLAVFVPVTNGVNYRVDGGDPTADVGMFAPANTPVIVEGVENVKNLLMIDTAAGASSVRVSVYF